MTEKLSFISKIVASFFSPSEKTEEITNVSGEISPPDRFQQVTGNPYKQMIGGKATVVDGRAIRRRHSRETTRLIEGLMPGIGDARHHPSPFQSPAVPKLDALLARDPGLEKQIDVIASRYAGKVDEIKTLIANAKLALKDPRMSAMEKQTLQDHLHKLRERYTFAKIEHRRAQAKVTEEKKRAKEEAEKIA